MKTLKPILSLYILTSLVLISIVGCSGGGGSGTSTAKIAKKTVDINVTLPSSSPIEKKDVSVYVFGSKTPIDKAGLAKVTVKTGIVTDISLILPKRDNDTLPTVYLSSTVVPGEINIHLNSEETAISLVLDGINQKYLQNPQIALFVKTLVKENSKDFIDYFKTAIIADPYLLRNDNLINVLDQEFLDAVSASNVILENTFGATSSPSPSPSKSSALNSGTSDSNTVSIIPQRLQFGFKLGEVIKNGQYTGDLTLWNFSFLPSLYRMTNTSTDEIVKDIPQGIFNAAFSPDIFAPYGCPFNISLPNSTLVENGAKNVQLVIYTPGLKDFDLSIYNEVGSPSLALLMRSAYSYAFIPVLTSVFPATGMAEAAFVILQKAGVFEDLLPYWSSGDIGGGLKKLYSNYNGLPKATIHALIEVGISKALKDPDVIVAVLGKKIATSAFAIASSAIAIAELKTGLEMTPSKTIFYATFPVGIKNIQPAAVKKVTHNETLPKFTLYGHGFQSFDFKGTTYNPSINLKVYDKKDNLLYSPILDYNQLSVNSTGTEISFFLPRYVVQTDTNLSYVQAQLKHAYVDVGFLGSIFDYYNTLHTIELPVTEAQQNVFTISLAADLYISKVDQDWKETNDTLLIYGGGFHTKESGIENEVYFIDNSTFSPIKAIVNLDSSWENMISATVPQALDLDFLSIGRTYFYVELIDGSKSNKFPLSIVPKPVKASVRGDRKTPGAIYKGQKVTLSQQSSVPIYYSLNGSAEQLYTQPIELQQTSTLFAYGVQEINGTNYRSKISEFHYETCKKGETYIPYPHGAQCVVIQNQHLLPTRYCPINSNDYSGNFYTDAYEVSCSFYSGTVTAEQHFITVKLEDNTTQRRQVQYTRFWYEPEGRPLYVTLGTEESYSFCPDGSFYPETGGCEHH